MDPTKDILQDKWPAVKNQALQKWSLLTAENWRAERQGRRTCQSPATAV
jgi:hypothetical protein